MEADTLPGPRRGSGAGDARALALRETRRTAEVSGTCDSRFAPLRDALAEQLAGGNELGASIAVDVDGETLVDIWGGWRDEERRAYHAHNRGHLVGELCL